MALTLCHTLRHPFEVKDIIILIIIYINVVQSLLGGTPKSSQVVAHAVIGKHGVGKLDTADGTHEAYGVGVLTQGVRAPAGRVDRWARRARPSQVQHASAGE